MYMWMYHFLLTSMRIGYSVLVLTNTAAADMLLYIFALLC